MALIGLLAGCSNPLALMGAASSDSLDVKIEAKVVKGSGEVVPVANTKFVYEVYDAAYTEAASSSFKVKDEGIFTTDFDGKATIKIHEGLVLISGYYSLLGGTSNIFWRKTPIKVTSSNPSIRLSNDNGEVINY